MLTILLRTAVIYILLIATMRFMGKRQLGELEISELVTTLLLSEIAALPISDRSVPITFAVIPLVTILTLEIALSVLLMKCPRLKNIASARPSVLIRHGKVDQGELRRIRVSIDELVSELRQSGFSSVDEVDYAILEQNGKISVLGKKSTLPPSAAALGITPPEAGIVHILIADGTPNDYNLHLLGLDRAWLREALAAHGKDLREIFFLGRDDSGKLFWIDEEET